MDRPSKRLHQQLQASWFCYLQRLERRISSLRVAAIRILRNRTDKQSKAPLNTTPASRLRAHIRVKQLYLSGRFLRARARFRQKATRTSRLKRVWAAYPLNTRHAMKHKP